MSQEVLLRIILSAIYALLMGCVVFWRQDEEHEVVHSRYSGQRYRPYISGAILPVGLLAVVVMLTALEGAGEAARMTLSICFGIFVQISLYYMLLLPLLPLLRRYISARACAMLWMIPNYLYFTTQSAMDLPGPGLVVFAPEKLVWVLFAVWLAGMMLVLGWKLAEHLMFRRRILAQAEEVTDPELLAVWERCLEQGNFYNPRFRLVTSDRVSTPLSVGLFFRTTRVVLPRRSYGPEELELILRHELVHIAREDAWSKFFLVFCTAMCWFNPLMWMAMGRSAEDMELSCDETVLLGEDETVRKRYARLLLDTAGDERGFTTCLSASARAMHHRLKCIVAPRKRSGGAIAVAVVFFLLCSTSGYVALAYEEGTGAQYIFPADGWEAYSVRDSIHLQGDVFNTTYEVADQEGFFQYLAGLRLYRITGNYSYSEAGQRLDFTLEGPEDIRMISLCDRAVRVTVYRDIKDYDTIWYHLPEGTDWAYVFRQAVVPRPALNVELYRGEERYPTDFPARLERFWKTENGRQVILYEAQEDYGAGVYSSQRFKRAVLSFSRVPVGACAAEIRSWDDSRSQSVSWEQSNGLLELELPDEPVHCTVTAAFRNADGELCQARFVFDVGDA